MMSLPCLSLLLIASLVLLTGCPRPAADPSNSATKTVVKGTPTPVGSQQLQETALEIQVKNRFLQEPEFQAHPIHIQARGDRVILTGTVADMRQKLRAERLTRDVPAVEEVENRLRIPPAGTPAPAKKP